MSNPYGEGLAFGNFGIEKERDNFDLFDFNEEPREEVAQKQQYDEFHAKDFFFGANEPSAVPQYPAKTQYPGNFTDHVANEIDSLEAVNEFSGDANSRSFNFENWSDAEPSPIMKPVNLPQKSILFMNKEDDGDFGFDDELDGSICNKTTMVSSQLAAIPKVFHEPTSLSTPKKSEESKPVKAAATTDWSQMNFVPESKLADKPDCSMMSSGITVTNSKEGTTVCDISNLGYNDIRPNHRNFEVESSNQRSSKPSVINSNSTDIEDVDLSQRKDVVNKTVLRILRRYFTQKFRNMFAQKFKSKLAKNKWYYEYVKRFTAEVFGESHQNLDALQTCIASIINPKHMRPEDIKETGLEKTEFFMYYDTIYKYSHSRLVSLFRIKPLAEIYETFFNGPMAEIMSSEPSVSKNINLYSAVFRDFLMVFRGAADVSTLTLN